MDLPLLPRIRYHFSKTAVRAPLSWWRHRGLRERDVLLASYPRSGNTWLRFLLFELITGRPAQFGEIDARDSPTGQLGDHPHMPRVLPTGGRVIKTHEPCRPAYRRAVYLVRDPRAVLLSEYRFLRWRGFFHGDLAAFVPRFVAGTVNAYGSWRDHVASWLDGRLAGSDDLLVVRFEDLRSATETCLRRIVDYLDLTVDDEALGRAIEDNTVARLREREDRARDTVYKHTDRRFRFINQGRVAGWREELDPAAAHGVATSWPEMLQRFGYPLDGEADG
jgi:Sulfotransferase domain